MDSDCKFCKSRVKFWKQFNVTVYLVAGTELVQPPLYMFTIFLLHCYCF